LTQFSLSETREHTNHLQERIQQFSPVSRDIMRQIVSKTLRLIQIETEDAADNDSGNIAESPDSPRTEHPNDTKLPDEDGAQQGD
jgi:hypothetical protein